MNNIKKQQPTNENFNVSVADIVADMKIFIREQYNAKCLREDAKLTVIFENGQKFVLSVS